jgi:ABC-type transport system involved in multi-copper enzyme maturation permease subunit
MKRLIHAEMLHLRSLKSTYLTALAIVVFVGVVISADASEAGASTSSKDLLDSFMSAVTLIPAMGLALFAATRTAGEFRYQTIAHRALAGPRRSQLVAAKLLAIIPYTLLIVAASITTALVASSVATDSAAQLHVSAVNVTEVLAGTTLFASLGVAVGFLARSQSAAILVVFGGWVFEKVLTGVVSDAGTLLPYGLLDALAGREAGAGAGLAVITAVALAASYSTLTKKDVI